MGQAKSKPPIRVIQPAPQDDDTEGSIDGVQDHDIEKGTDTLGIVAEESGYPEPEPQRSARRKLPKENGHIRTLSPINESTDNLNGTEFNNQLIGDENNADTDETRGQIYTPVPVGASFYKLYSYRSSTPAYLDTLYPRYESPAPGAWMTSHLDLDSSFRSTYVNSTMIEPQAHLDHNKFSLSKRERMLYEREKYEYKVLMSMTPSESEMITSPRRQFVSPLPPEIASLPTDNVKLNIEVAMTLADKHKSHRAETYTTLVQDLTEGIAEESLKVVVILAWISKQPIGRLDFGVKPIDPDTPNGYMKLMQEYNGTYPVFFALICRAANIGCVVIPGISKSSSYEVGCSEEESGSLRNSWNAVYVNQIWRLVHPLWVCKGLAGKRQEGWLKIETESQTTTGQKLNCVPPSEGTETSNFNDYFIFSEPAQFIYRNFPDTEKWQLLQNSWTMDAFFERPYLRPAFFKNGFKLLSENACCLVSEDGRACVIKIGLDADESANVMFSYDLRIKIDNSSPNNDVKKELYEKQAEFGRFVLLTKESDSAMFEVRFPEKGCYKLRIYAGKLSDTLEWIMDTKLRCNELMHEQIPLPFDPGVVGWGPNVFTENLGLYVPSHVNSTVEVLLDEKPLFQFVLLKRIEVNVELFGSESTETFLEQFVKHEIIEVNETLELRIDVSLDGHGEFALKINITKDNVMRNVCNYVITTVKQKPHEDYYTRKARRELKEGMVTCNLDGLEAAIEACAKVGIPDTDPDLRGGKTKYEYLRCKRDLHTSLLVTRIDFSKQALYRTNKARLGVLLRRDVARVEAHLKHLLELDVGGWTYKIPEIDRMSVMELGHLRHPKPAVQDIAVAMFLLLGVPDEELTHWSKVKRLLHEQDATLIEITRMEKYLDMEDRDMVRVNDNVLERVHAILNTHTEEDIRRADNTAAAFYKWVSAVFEKLKQRHDSFVGATNTLSSATTQDGATITTNISSKAPMPISRTSRIRMSRQTEYSDHASEARDTVPSALPQFSSKASRGLGRRNSKTSTTSAKSKHSLTKR